ncbi:alcohol dehydrogenase class IV [Cupriavidus gilardii J11]|uniref:Alcohol dehydrogenase class IV n=1 Tax=Cupriavidus gilardii J11 TaxID=936133 RepID=A0A562BT89_9BURK|nr:iron-containing alcohol dehydrogenase [Cupriavidus gilardii]TWG88487.1 alcohol dehydrogenase class IV [Cupriavidus gilardii J11]
MRIDDLVYFCAPARLVVGPGSRAQLPALLQRLGYRHGVLVTDGFFTGHTPWVGEYVDGARAHGIDTVVYDGGLPDPSTTLCDEATASLRERLAGRTPDHVVALGGGSNIDLAKALTLTLRDGAPIRSFAGALPAGVRPIPLVAMPTTSGTGSEATPGAILVDPDNATKIAVMDNALRPAIALIDPEFTYGCPPRVTADAGIDALTHAVESYLTIDSARYPRQGHADPGYSGRSALTMLFARESIALCAHYLLRAYRDGADTEARIGMSYASLYAALSYGSAGLNAVHGIAYAVAGATHRSHGSTNAVMLPYVLDAIKAHRRAEFIELAALLGVEGSSVEQRIGAVPRAIRALVAALDIPVSLQGFGIGQEALPALVDDALGVTRLAQAFPVPDVPRTYGCIVERAWRGWLEGDDGC